MATKKKTPAKARSKKAGAALALPRTPEPVSAPAARPSSQLGVRALVLLAVVAFVGWKLLFKTRIINVQADLKNAVASYGYGRDQVVGCRTLAIDKAGNVFYYFVGRLKKFSSEGKLLAFPDDGKPMEKLPYMGLWALAPDQAGGVWACDKGGSRLLHFDDKLKMVGSIKTDDVQLSGLAIDSQGRFITAAGLGYVQVLDPSGKPLFRAGEGGSSPIGAAHRVVVDDQDNIYVLDSAGCSGQPLEDPTVRSYDKDGKPLAHWKALGSSWNDFSYLAYDPQGYIAVTNSGGGSAPGVTLYTKAGQERYVVVSANGIGLQGITGLAISSDGDWIVDDTPSGRGCDRLGLPVLNGKRP